MPKQVDHDERRAEIARAIARLAARRGLQDVSFREVAAEAGMSVANVQYYFGTKHNMLVGTLDHVSAALSDRIQQFLAALDADSGPLDQVQAVAAAFVPVDDVTHDAMVVFHGFAAAALTDPDLRSIHAFRRGWTVIEFFDEQLRSGQASGEVDAAVQPDREAIALLSLVLGLSLSVLLGQVSPQDARDALAQHLRRLEA